MDTGSLVSFPVPPESAPPVQIPWYSWRRWGWNFLTFSILAHLGFGIVAAYFIVANIQGKRKQDFQAPGAKGLNAPTHALEHKVQMAKKQSSMSAPVAAKRITTTGLAKVALPSMPAMPKMDAVVMPAAMTGMGGSGMGLGGFGGGAGGGSGGGGGGGLSLFGMRNRTGGSLVGHLYDLKQDKSRHPTNMTEDKYSAVARQFVQGGFNVAALASYYQASVPLYATEMFTPNIDANEAPKAFGVESEVQPRLWLAVYHGTVIPTETGTYKFVGFGDDVLVVRFDHRVVLDGGYNNPSGITSSTIHYYSFQGGDWYAGQGHKGGHKEGPSFNVEAGKPYDMDILIGEQPGGQSCFQLLIKKDGETYSQDDKHNPVLPIFRLVGSGLPEPNGALPPFATEGPIWKAEMPSGVPTSQQ